MASVVIRDERGRFANGHVVPQAWIESRYKPKFCRLCGNELIDENWPLNFRKRWGYLCRACKQVYQRDWSKESRKNNPEKHRRQQRKHRLRYPEKIKARNFVNNHNLPLGSECEFCGRTEKLEHGHIDYDYPEIYLTVCHECNQNMEISP